MTIEQLNFLFIGLVILAVVVVVIVYLMNAFYRRASAVRSLCFELDLADARSCWIAAHS